MDQEEESTTPPVEPRRRVRRFLRWGRRRGLFGPVVLTVGLFTLVYASASTTTNIDDAQPIDYYEECDREGCAREEVVELWETFHHECFIEGCWMEEVGENAGSSVHQDQNGNWYYGNPGAVGRMLDYFVTRLGLPGAADVTVRPGLTDTWFDRTIRTLLRRGITISVTCREMSGGSYDCGP